MSRTLALAALTLSCATAAAESPAAVPVPGPETASPPPPVAELIARLSGDDFTAREAATRGLIARSGEALPALRKALADADAEARRRLEGVIKHLEHQQLVAPRRVTLRAVDRPVSSLVADLARQSGYKINGDSPGARLTLDLVDVPFWEALDKLCLSANLIPNTNDDGTVYLSHQDQYVPFVDYAGPFRVSATGFHLNKSVNFGQLARDPARNHGGHASEHFQFSFCVASEPRLPLLGLGQAKLTAAEDDRGRSLVLPPNAHQFHHSYYYGGHRSLMQHGGVPLAPPDRDARRLRRVAGTVPVTVLLEQRPAVTLDNILKAGKQKGTYGPVTLEVFKVTESNGRNYAVELSLRHENRPPDPSWSGSLYQRIELQDADGRKYQPQGSNENTSPAGVSGTFQYGHTGQANLGKPARLVYQHWNTAQHTVAFEFRDLPLP